MSELMSDPIVSLSITAATLGFVHTLFGPDHYLPFIVMSRSGEWSLRKTGVVTFLCGVAHVLSSVLLGFIGIALGLAVGKLEAFESVRGDIAAWLLLAFGLVYFVWGARRAWRNQPHAHRHFHLDDSTESAASAHSHEHTHHRDHAHLHEAASAENAPDRPARPSLTPWVLFTIFVFGPCEPLIPLLMYPAARHSLAGTTVVAAVFCAATLATMMTIVTLSSLGITRLPTRLLERYTHAIAGATLALCGAGIVFLGL